MEISKKDQKSTVDKSKFPTILILCIAIFEICLFGYYFFAILKKSIHFLGYFGFFIILLLFFLFILFKLIFNFSIINLIVLELNKFKLGRFIYKQLGKLFRDREELTADYFYKYVLKNLIFSISFVFAVFLLFSLDLWPILTNVFHKPSVAIAIILVVYFGVLFLQMNLISFQTFLNKNRIYWYILNFGVLFYFWVVVKIYWIFCILFLILIIVELCVSSKKTDLDRYQEIVLLSIIVFILGFVLLTGLFSMDYTISNNQTLSLFYGDENIVCSSGNDFNLILENSLIDCNIIDKYLAVDSINVYSKSKDSIIDEIHLTDYDENKLIMYVPQNIYELKILSNNNEYIAKNLKLMTIEDYEKNRQDFGKYFFLLLGVVFLTIPGIVKAYLDIKKKIK